MKQASITLWYWNRDIPGQLGKYHGGGGLSLFRRQVINSYDILYAQ